MVRTVYGKIVEIHVLFSNCIHEEHRDAVLQNLLQLVMDVTPELHVNQKLVLERENA